VGDGGGKGDGNDGGGRGSGDMTTIGAAAVGDD
jgi:hypothetical protein